MDLYEITFKDRTVKTVDAVRYELTSGWFLFYWPAEDELIYQVDATEVMAIEKLPGEDERAAEPDEAS